MVPKMKVLKCALWWWWAGEGEGGFVATQADGVGNAQIHYYMKKGNPVGSKTTLRLARPW